MPPITVTKASGEKEPFDENKLRRSLKSIGLDTRKKNQILKEAQDICKSINIK